MSLLIDCSIIANIRHQTMRQSNTHCILGSLATNVSLPYSIALERESSGQSMNNLWFHARSAQITNKSALGELTMKNLLHAKIVQHQYKRGP